MSKALIQFQEGETQAQLEIKLRRLAEQVARIDSTARVRQLEAKVAALEARVAALEAP